MINPTRLLKFSVIATFYSVLYSCGDASIQTDNSLNGSWESVGSGWLLEIVDSANYYQYDITAISCTLSREGSFEELKNYLRLDKDTLILSVGVMNYPFVRVSRTAAQRKASHHGYDPNSPVYNFDVFAETVEDHYAFFELNAIQWKSVREHQRAQISESSSEVELYQVMEETLELLNDNHAYLEADDAVYETLEDSLDTDEESFSEEESLNSTATKSASTTVLREYGDFEVADLIADTYLQEEYTDDSWLIRWGILQEGIGYIQCKAMWLYADLEIPKTLIESQGYVDAYVYTFNEMVEAEYIEMEVEGVRKIMDRVMADLSDMDAIVLDIRFNGGGQDAVSFEILSRFNPEKQAIAQAKRTAAKGYAPQNTLFLQSVQKPFTKPVYILTSRQSGSAAEALAIGSMALPNVKRIGARTMGALSTALEKKLPNGWSFSISNEVYQDLQGTIYENIGVPVDIQLDYPEDRQVFFRMIAEDPKTDKDRILMAF